MLHLMTAGLCKNVHVITMGDMCQLPPPNTHKPLYADCVLKARNPQVFSSNQTRLNGINDFLKLRKFELTLQNRAKDDLGHCKRIDQLRCGIIDDNILDSLKPLTREDTRNEWEFVPILVTSNCERVLINRLQVVAYAKKYGLPVLRWVNPVRNCDEQYPVDTIESLLPAVVQYFALGAPANIVQNHNPVATGIVNGTRVIMHSLVWSNYTWTLPADSTPGQVHDVPRPDYVVVVRDDDDFDETADRHHELIPLQLEPDAEIIQGVKLLYKAFPLDLGFAITFHKVQGQTMRRIIMFLHERKTRQLAKLMWESFYVAYTRVKYGDNIRVCYAGSDVMNPTTTIGLQHIKKLRRPELYDVWQDTYDKEGRWDDRELKAGALRKRKQLRSKLRKVSSLNRTCLKKLKMWADILDVPVKCKPNTTRRNKQQYLDAIKPIWVGCRAGTLQTDGTIDTTRRAVKQINRNPSQMVKVTHRSTKQTNNTNHSQMQVSKTSVTFASRRQPPSRHWLKGDDITKANLTFKQRHTVLAGLNHRIHSKATMQRMVFARGTSRWFSMQDFYELTKEGEFINDKLLTFMLERMCPSAYVPSFVTDTRIDHFRVREDQRSLQEFRDRVKRWVDRIESGAVLMMPYNWPINKHWVAVFVWKDRDQYYVQARNSYAPYTRHDSDTLSHAQKLVNKLYAFVNREVVPNCKQVASPTVTEQVNNECAFHVVANGVLAHKNCCFTHTFDNDYIDYIRTTHVVSLAKLRGHTMTRNVIQITRPLTVMKVKRKYFVAIENDQKFIEVRPDYPSYSSIEPGSTIRFKCGLRSCDKTVVDIRRYRNMDYMFNFESVRACLPHLSEMNVDEAVHEYHSIHGFERNVATHHGVCVFEVTNVLQTKPILLM